MTKALLFVPALLLAVAPAAGAAQADEAAPKAATRADFEKAVDARFARMDSNGDSILSRAEIAAAHLKLVESASAALRKAAESEFAAVDKDKNGKLTLAEVSAAAPASRKAEAAKAVQRLDSSKDGAITLAEFLAAAPKPAPDGVAKFLKRYDSDKDGRVTKAEYRAPGLANFDRLDRNKDGLLNAADKPAAKPKG